jgi:hypothetical protein
MEYSQKNDNYYLQDKTFRVENKIQLQIFDIRTEDHFILK